MHRFALTALVLGLSCGLIGALAQAAPNCALANATDYGSYAQLTMHSGSEVDLDNSAYNWA